MGKQCILLATVVHAKKSIHLIEKIIQGKERGNKAST